MVVSEDLRKAYTEVYLILSFIDEYYMNKVSSKFIEYIYKQKDDNYIPNIDLNKPLDEQNLLEDTVNMLAIIKYNYWCDNEDEKKELINILNENENKYQDALKQMYNTKDIFGKIEKEDSGKELVIYKENILKRILKKIKQFLKLKK